MIQKIDSWPRWFLVTVCGVSMSALTLLMFWTIRQAFADVETIKTVAYTAKNSSDSNTVAIEDLKDQIGTMSESQETFRKEYREDTKETQKVLQQLLLEVKK